jgi:hypothetical protein
MRISFIAAAFLVAIITGLAPSVAAQVSPARAAETSSAAPQSKNIDGIAARIGNDVVMESEVRQLEDYQQLIEGQAQSRSKVIEELVDQWIVKTEAATSNFPRPSVEDVSQEYQALTKQFSSPQQLEARMSQVGLTTDEVRNILERQLYYARFVDFKFHSSAAVTAAQIDAYYRQDFAPELQKRKISVPPIEKVETEIRELLTQEAINEKTAKWLEEAKAKLKIVIQPSGGGG